VSSITTETSFCAYKFAPETEFLSLLGKAGGRALNRLSPADMEVAMRINASARPIFPAANGLSVELALYEFRPPPWRAMPAHP